MTHPRRIIDLSHSLSAETPPFPGDPPVEITIFDSTDRPSAAGERHMNCSRLAASIHCGTHMDAPFHFFGGGSTIDRIPLERTIGPATLVHLPWQTRGSVIDAAHLAEYEVRLRSTGRVVFNTGWYQRWGAEDYFTAHPVLTGAAAQQLIDWGVHLVGVDTPSVDRDPYPAHMVLLGNEALIVENLTNLDAITTDTFELVVTPLALKGRDGSPVRAVAIL